MREPAAGRFAREDAESAPPSGRSGDRVARVFRPVLLRTQPALRPFWRIVFRVFLAWLVRALRPRDAGAYLRGSFARGQPLYGLSDLDLIVVVPDPERPGEARRAVVGRWQRLCRAVPGLARLVRFNVYEQSSLADVASATLLTYGLDGRSERDALFFGRVPETMHYSLPTRPGLAGPTSDWRLVAGPERRPPVRAPGPDERWLNGWLELQCWWRYAFSAAADPDGVHTARTCVRLVAEPARTWLWLVSGERVSDVEAVLQAVLRRLPEEEAALRGALALRKALLRSPRAPLEEVLPWLVRISTRVARLFAEAAEERGTTSARLLRPEGSEPPARPPLPAGARLLPLVDWRARALPESPDEALVLLEGDPGEPRALATAAALDGPGRPCPALLAPGLLVLPSLDRTTEPVLRAVLRAVQCAMSDPVSFALVAGRGEAVFPNLPGWSAEDSARRAAAEHRAWLEVELPKRPDGPETLGKLLTAARAALFQETLESGDPELAVGSEGTREQLSARHPRGRAAVEDACADYRAWRFEGRPPRPAVTTALADLVRSLPPYRDGVRARPRVALERRPAT